MKAQIKKRVNSNLEPEGAEGGGEGTTPRAGDELAQRRAGQPPSAGPSCPPGPRPRTVPWRNSLSAAPTRAGRRPPPGASGAQPLTCSAQAAVQRVPPPSDTTQRMDRPGRGLGPDWRKGVHVPAARARTLAPLLPAQRLAAVLPAVRGGGLQPARGRPGVSSARCDRECPGLSRGRCLTGVRSAATETRRCLALRLSPRP